MSEIKFPQQFKFLFEPKRYKIARGGRGSTKSWSFARALLILGSQRPLRILCAREVQKSIKDSVHRLLSDRIEELGMGNFYEILDAEIRGKNGTVFLFSGLATHTIESIKSFEGVDITWIEEGKNVSQKSFDVLMPTVLRKDTSELWITFNPELDTDPVYLLAVVNPPPADECISVEVNYLDVPEFFPESLEKLRQLHERSKPKPVYENIWLGKCLPAVEGAIYAAEAEAIAVQGRLRDVPYDPMYKVHVVFDLGWNDAMSISCVQRVASELRVINYIEDSHRTLESYSKQLREMDYNWGSAWLPHDGFARKHQTGRTDAEVMSAFGWDVIPREQIAIVDVEQGIKTARMTLPRMYFDHKAARLVECIKRYRRHIPTTTGEAAGPVHDEFSHGADNIRYIAVNSHQFENETWGGGQLNYPRLSNA